MKQSVTPDDAVCRTCGYSLRELISRHCPECGRMFDPANPASYRLRADSWWSRFDGPPSRRQTALIALIAALWVLDASAPGRPVWLPACFLLDLLVPLMLITLGVVFLVHAVVTVRAGTVEAPPINAARTWWRWFVLPAAFATIVSTTTLVSPNQVSWPMRLRFYVSRPAFDDALAAYLADKSSGTKPRLIGLYWVQNIRACHDGAILFQTKKDYGFKGPYYLGFTPNPAGTIPRQRELLWTDSNHWQMHTTRQRPSSESTPAQ